MSELKKIEDGKVEIICTIEGEDWTKAIAKAFKKLNAALQIKGFRKGQVPTTLAKKYISDQQTQYEAVNALTDETFKKVLEENEVELIDKANLDIKEIDDKHVVMVFTCPVKPDVKLGDYKALKYEVEDVNIGDKEVDEEVQRRLEAKADLELKEDGTVENGDTAVIDFEGFKDGVAFDGGKGENYDLVIGSGSFIPGFEEQLIGMKPEEEKDINLTFPEDYHVASLKGAPVTFKVKVHEIKKKVLPNLDDEFVKELKIDNVETVDQYKNYLKDQLTNFKKSEVETKASENIIRKLAEICEVNIPEVMINTEVDNLMQEQAQRLMYQGLSMEQYKKIIDQTDEQIKESLKPSAIDRVKATLCLEALAKEEKIEVTKEDIDKHYEEIGKTYGMEAEEVKKYIPEENVKSDLKTKKALDFLKNNK